MADFKSVDCEKCEFYPRQFVTYLGDPATAELLVVIDTPVKQDGRHGNLLRGVYGSILTEYLEKFVSPDKICYLPAVRCFPPKDNVISPIANACWKRYGAPLLAQYKGDKIIAAGFWPIRHTTGRFQQEVGGKVMRFEGRQVACIEHPHVHVRKYVQWEERPGGKGYRPNRASIGRAKRSFLQEGGPVINQLFGRKIDIDMTTRVEVPFKRVTDESEMVNRILEYKGQLVFHDYETENKSGYDGPGKRTALDWFYGPEYASPMCVGFSFFQNPNEISFDAAKQEIHYAEDKVVVYTGEVTTRIANVLNEVNLMAFNAPYDTGVTYVHTGVLNDIYADPMHAAYVVDQSRFKFNLESLAFQYVPELANWAQNIKGKGAAVYADMFRPKLWQYNAVDCIVPMMLFWRCYELIAERGQEFLFWEIMAGCATLLRDMEARGIYVNQETLPKIQKKFNEELRTLVATFKNSPEALWLYNKTGKEFNPNSGPQVMRIYNECIGADLPNSQKRTLRDFVEQQGGHVFTETLLKYRQVSKLHSTYCKGLSERIDHERNLVFASYKTTTTDTGRSSSGGSDAKGLGKTNQINIQNIPRGSHLRTTYQARPDHWLAYADYGQIELRVAGAYARSKEIAEITNSGKDFHSMMAAVAFGKDYEHILEEDKRIDEAGGGTSLRTASKSISFGLLYGMTEEGLALRLGLRNQDNTPDVHAARQYIEDYFAGMPSVKTFIDDTHAFAKKYFHVQTVFGRVQRYKYISARALRQAVNTLVQATAADIFMLGIRTSWEEWKKHKFVVKEVAGTVEVASARGVPVGTLVRTRKPMYQNVIWPWAEVHDSMTWECSNVLPKELVEEIMVNAMVVGVRRRFPVVDKFLGDIPLEVDFKSTINWV